MSLLTLFTTEVPHTVLVGYVAGEVGQERQRVDHLWWRVVHNRNSSLYFNLIETLGNSI